MTTTGTGTADEDQVRAVIADRVTAMRGRGGERFVAGMRAARVWMAALISR